MTNKHIQTILEEFTNEYAKNKESFRGNMTIQDKTFVISFFTKVLQSYTDKVIDDILPEKRQLPKTKCLNAEMRMFGKCFNCEEIKGMNSFRQQIIDNYNKLKKGEL